MYDGLSGWNSQGTASGQNAPMRFLGIFSLEQNLLFFILNCLAASLDCNYGVSAGLGNKERQRYTDPRDEFKFSEQRPAPHFFADPLHCVVASWQWSDLYRLCTNTGKKMDHPSTRAIAIVPLMRRSIVENSSRRMIRLLARIYTQTDY